MTKLFLPYFIIVLYWIGLSIKITPNKMNMKGLKNGNCNRTACQQPSADFYNHSTRAWYCGKCANMINKMNPESYQIFGHALCTHESQQVTIDALSED